MNSPEVKNGNGFQLKYLRKKFNLTQDQLAEKLDVSKSLITAIESNNRNISFPMYKKIKDIFGVDVLIIDEKGNLDPLKAHNKGYTSTDFIDMLSHIEDKSECNIVQVPFYSAKAAAGEGAELPIYTESEIMYFDKRWLKNVLGVNPDNLSVIQATGDSMDGGSHPIKDGDMLLVDTSNITPVNNQVYVFRVHYNSDLIVKRINIDFNGKITLISDNPEYSRKIYPESEDCIIGKVVWNGSKETI